MSSRLLRSILTKPNLPRTDIPAYVKDKTFGKLSEKSKLEFLWQYRTAIIRQRYATFGKDSGKFYIYISSFLYALIFTIF